MVKNIILPMQEFDIVLTDMNMPEMDGAQLIKLIRESLKMNIPIIVITTMGEEKDRERGVSLGANGYITKPIKGFELRDTVMQFI